MGTNYYAKIDDEWVHIGKSSMGNRFLWHGCYEDEWPSSVVEWLELLGNNPDMEIEDEYDAPISVADFLAMVEGLQENDLPPPQRNPRPGVIPEHVWQSMLPSSEGEYRISYGEFS